MNAHEDKAKTIFLNAVDITSETERLDYLKNQCGEDAKLRSEVDELLSHQLELSNFLESPSPDIAATALLSATKEKVGTLIGPYKIREQLAEGGMGVVYVADQEEPVRRRVALKVIKPGMATKDVVARFEAERQALAMMDHPHIAHIFDGGVTESGQPFFAMELVQGLSITDYCDEHKLTSVERLQLFSKVCKAVQHAHQKGIIHRDIKPSNVLIAEIDGAAVPKIIDFGVAKAVSQKLTDQTIYTQFSQMVGTPLYMSPEQVSLGTIDIDTRSDVYSLGVLLYELLTGKTPFDREIIKQSGFDEFRRVIREDEPQRPSAAVSTLQAQALSTIAENHHIDPRKLGSELQGELDWIVMRALEKDRNRRYESASSFAADIERYLIDEPVEACPPSKAYRLQKFTKRNKAFLTTAAIVLIALVAGTGIASWQAVVANEERAQAQLAEEKAKESKAKAEQEGAISKAVINFLQEDLLGKASPNETHDPEVKLSTILDRAAAEIKNKFPGQPLVEATLQDTIGQAYQTLGKYKEAEAHLQRAVELSRKERGADDPQTLVYSSRLGWIISTRGRYLEAHKSLEKTFKSQQQVLGKEHPDTLKTMNHLGDALRLLGKNKEAEVLILQVLEVRNRTLGKEHIDTLTSMYILATIYKNQGRSEEAEKLQLQTLEIQKRTLGEEHRYTLASMHSLATSYQDRADYDAAKKLFMQTLEILKSTLGEQHPTTLQSTNNLANTYLKQGDYKEAEKVFLQTLEDQKRILGQEHPDALISMSNLASTYRLQGRLDEAEKLYIQTLEIKDRILGKEHPATLASMNRLGSLYLAQGRYHKAEKLHLETLKIQKQTLGEEHPETLNTMNDLASDYHKLARYSEAEKLHLKTYEIRKQTFGEEHDATQTSVFNLTNVYKDQGRYKEAEKLLLQTSEISKRTRGDEHPFTLGSNLSLANIYRELKRNDLAESLLLQTLEIQKRTLGEEHPSTLLNMGNLAVLYNFQKKYGEVEKLRLQLIETQTRILGEEHPNTLMTMANLALTYAAQKRHDEAEELSLQTIEKATRVLGEGHPATVWMKSGLRSIYAVHCWQLITATDPNDSDVKKALELARKAIELSDEANNWNNLGVALYRNGEYREAVEALEKADKLLEGQDRTHRPFLAMSHWQLGNKETAKLHYQLYIAWYLSKNRGGTDQRFLAEMETLLGITAEDRQAHADEYHQRKLESLSQEIQAKPDDADLRLQRAAIYLTLKQWEQRAVDLEVVVSQRPDDFKIVNQLSWAYAKSNRGELALNTAKTLIRLGPDNATGHARLTEAHLLLKDYESVITFCTRLIELNSDNHTAYQRRAQAYALLYQWQAALTDIVRFNELKPFDGRGWHHEALIRVAMNDPAGYQEFCQLMLEQHHEKESDGTAVFMAASWALPMPLSEGTDEVIAVMKKLVAETPEHSHRLRILGSLYYRQKDYPLAAQTLERAVALNDTEVRNLAWMAMCQYQLGDTDSATDWLDRAQLGWQESLNTNDLSFLLETRLLLEEAETLIRDAVTTKGEIPQVN